MPYYVTPTTAYKLVRNCWTSVGGGWKRITGRWVAVGGAWALKYVAGTPQLQNATVRGFCYHPDVPMAEISFDPDGGVTATYSTETLAVQQEMLDWFDPAVVGVGAFYEIRAKRIAGAIPLTAGSDAENTWLPLTQTRNWKTEGTGANNRTDAVTFQIELRPVGGSIEVSATVSLSVTAYDPGNTNGGAGYGGGTNLISRPRFHAN